LLGVSYYVNVTPPFTSVLFFSVLITWWNNFGVIGCFETPCPCQLSRLVG